MVHMAIENNNELLYTVNEIKNYMNWGERNGKQRSWFK